MKKPAFSNKQVTELAKRYAKHKTMRLRNQILRLTLPLVEAAMARQGMRRNKDDIRQECILKVLQAIPKFDPKRGDAFGFFWATICNMSKTINQRLHKPISSLSTDDLARREAEQMGKDTYQTPENQYTLNLIGEAVENAFLSNGFSPPRKRLHRKACRYIHKSMVSGEFFFEKNKVVRRLKSIGLNKKEVQHYCQYSLVVVRAKLLEARENASTLSYPKVGKTVSTILDCGDL